MKADSHTPVVEVPVGLDGIEEFITSATRVSDSGLLPFRALSIYSMSRQGADLRTLTLAFSEISPSSTLITVHFRGPRLLLQTRRAVIHRFFLAVQDEIDRRAETS